MQLLELVPNGFVDFGTQIGVYLAKNIAYNTQKYFDATKLW